MSAQKSSARARPPEAQPARPARAPTDFDLYLVSPDAQLAEFWQLQALCGLRRAMGDRPLSQAGYRRVRAALAEEVVVRRFRSTRNAQAWLEDQGFEYAAAERRWQHADGRSASIERSPTSSLRFVRVVWEE